MRGDNWDSILVIPPSPYQLKRQLILPRWNLKQVNSPSSPILMHEQKGQWWAAHNNWIVTVYGMLSIRDPGRTKLEKSLKHFNPHSGRKWKLKLAHSRVSSLYRALYPPRGLKVSTICIWHALHLRKPFPIHETLETAFGEVSYNLLHTLPIKI